MALTIWSNMSLEEIVHEARRNRSPENVERVLDLIEGESIVPAANLHTSSFHMNSILIWNINSNEWRATLNTPKP